MKQVVQRAKARWKRWSRAIRITLVVLILLLVGARLAMPYAVHRYVNYKLDQLLDYDGRIGDVDIHLFRGAYSINHIQRFPYPGCSRTSLTWTSGERLAAFSKMLS